MIILKDKVTAVYYFVWTFILQLRFYFDTGGNKVMLIGSTHTLEDILLICKSHRTLVFSCDLQMAQ